MKFKQVIHKAHYWATPLYERLPLWLFPQRPLRFKAYCIGLPKTGTISMHIIFSHQYRSAHETESRFLINKILALDHGKIDANQFTQYVKHRDRRLGLEMDSSHLNYFLLDILVKEFSEAKFILTIRDCYSWLDSQINHRFAHALWHDPWTKRPHRALSQFIHQAGGVVNYAKEEQVLADHGLYPLDSYFSWWTKRHTKIFTTVPAERLLVVKTREINPSLPKVEAFLGIEPHSLPTHIHGNKADKKLQLLAQIDRDFLEAKANLHCKELMDKYFPEIKGYNRK